MTAARLSPAASLLRNSKLFALPPAIALPVPEPSSEPVPRSDTATSIYPTRAAIETSLTSLGRGDWGFKRPLPLKSTTKSGSPSIRLNKGIDTAEHIADFDSAADHVLTLKKFQELNQSIQHPRQPTDRSTVHYSAFRKEYDNTANISESSPANAKYTGVWPSLTPLELQKQLPDSVKLQGDGEHESSINKRQPLQRSVGVSSNIQPRRWRYDGPSLVQMSGLEFDRWMKTLDASKKQAFREYVRRTLLVGKRINQTARAQAEARVGEIDSQSVQISEAELTEHMRKLRQQPREFGSLIAAFLDLPEGPEGQRTGIFTSDVWIYGRNTLASESYNENGPPKTHPSAGLSYIHSNRWAQNHVVFGPQNQRQPVVARQLKTRARGNTNLTSIGVAGFLVERAAAAGVRETTVPPFEPQPGGQKTVVIPSHAEVDEKGALKFVVKPTNEYLVEEDKAVHNSMIVNPRVAALRPGRGAGSRVMQPLTRTPPSPMDYKKREDLSLESSDPFEFLGRTQ